MGRKGDPRVLQSLLQVFMPLIAKLQTGLKSLRIIIIKKKNINTISDKSSAIYISTDFSVIELLFHEEQCLMFPWLHLQVE